MGLAYIARCKAGKVVAASIANTPLEQADCASDVKKWSKELTVTLEQYDKKTCVWCFKGGKKACKTCEEVKP